MSQPQTDAQNQRPPTDFTKLEHVTVSMNRPAKWYMYIAKKVLKERGSVDIRSRPSAAGQVVRVVEALKRLGYLEYVSFKTVTLESINNNLVRFFVVSVRKSSNFEKLYESREEERKKMLEASGRTPNQQQP
jgi:hypothetical protein